ncbi:MAG: glycosyltransferase family 2 protein [Rhodothermales bacterium]
MSAEKAPIVTIGLPVYNGAKHIRDCLDSLLNQSFTDLEIVILDNASTDETEAICREYAAKDDRIQYRRQTANVGAAANFNEVFTYARGKYFKWAAHDDVCAPTFIEACVQVLDEHPDTVLAFTGTELINDDGSLVVFDPSKNAYVDSGGRNWVIYFEESMFSEDPIERFSAILTRSKLCHEVFGVIRTEALSHTSLIGAYYGSDKVLLAELCLQGRFEQLLDSLFYRRCHPVQSSKRPIMERERWISGKEPGLFVFPQRHVLAGYIHAALHARLPVGQRMRGLKAVLQYALSPEKLSRLSVRHKNSYLRFKKKDRPVTTP